MGQGDRFMQPSFSVPMPSGDVDWPMPSPDRTRRFCPTCDRPASWCECPTKFVPPTVEKVPEGEKGSTNGSLLALLAVAVFLFFLLQYARP